VLLLTELASEAFQQLSSAGWDLEYYPSSELVDARAQIHPETVQQRAQTSWLRLPEQKKIGWERKFVQQTVRPQGFAHRADLQGAADVKSGRAAEELGLG